MKKLILKTIAIPVVIVAGLLVYIVGFGMNDATQKADVIVVFGNTVNADGSLSPRLRARVDRAIQLFNEGKGDFLFVSGALGKEGVEESGAMKAYAMAHGVPESRIIADAMGTDTDATAKNARDFMVEREKKSVILVSQYFHLARASFAFHSHGITEVGHARSYYIELRDAYSLLREVVALPVYWLKRWRAVIAH